MPSLTCPTCRAGLNVTHQLTGKSIKCTKCGIKIHPRANQELSANIPKTPVSAKPAADTGARWGMLLLSGLLLAGVSALIFFQSNNAENARTKSIAQNNTRDIGSSGANSNSDAPSLTKVAFRQIPRDGFRRVALVIGNSAYKDSPLANPINDAKSIGQALKAVGFEVVMKFDRSKYEMEDDVDQITSDLSDGDAVFIFYAGHGLQIDNANYLVPVDARVTKKHHVSQRCVGTDYLMAALDASEASLRVLILDACRNNPFRGFSRSGTRGLIPIAAPRGTIVAYSTSPGTEAMDGDGNNSPYAKHFVSKLRDAHPKGLEVNRLFREVAQAVRKETGQRPYRNFDDSMDDFMLIEAISGPPKTITNSLKAELNLIPSGKFWMGAAPSAEGAKSKEAQHHVEIMKAFYLGATEVTQHEWFSVMNNRPWEERAYEEHPMYESAPRNPATYINWEEANAFCRMLSKKENRVYRLPTEAEWEYACRANRQDRSKYSYGNGESQLSDHAWFHNRNSNERIADKAPQEVARKKPNGLGLFDMHGNVHEWCSDWFDRNYYSKSKSTIRDPQGPDSGTRRVMRGGAFSTPAKNCRSAHRSQFAPDVGSAHIGFRVVLELESDK